MALVVESGTGSTTAESYISVADASTYHSNRGNTAWAALATDAIREQCLRKATDFMEQAYRKRWSGYRNTATQVLSWPRSYVYLEPFVSGAVGAYPYLVADNIVPTEVKNACAILALKASTDTLAPDLTQAVLREKVDVLEVEYDKYSPQQIRYQEVENMLAPYFGQQSGANVGLNRV